MNKNRTQPAGIQDTVKTLIYTEIKPLGPLEVYTCVKCSGEYKRVYKVGAQSITKVGAR